MAAKQQFTIVYYYVPQDLDEFTQLNAFVIRKKIEEIRLPDIVAQFPMQGAYHFRFRCNVQKNRPVWLDLNNTTCKLPLSDDGKIIMKVTRVSWTDSHTQPVQISKMLDQEEKQKPAKPSPQPQPPSQPQNPNLIGFETIVDKPGQIPKPAEFQQSHSEKQLPTTAAQMSQNPEKGGGMFGVMEQESSGSVSPENTRMRVSAGGTNVSVRLSLASEFVKLACSETTSRFAVGRT